MAEKVERVKTSLQINEDIDLHVTGWVVQRIGWAVMLTILILSALGLFGNGVLSDRKVAKKGISVAYQRFCRYETETEMEITAQAAGRMIEVILPAAFVEMYNIKSVQPEPETQRIKNGSAVYAFGAEGTGRITIFLSPRKQGDVHPVITVNDTDFELSAFIYP